MALSTLDRDLLERLLAGQPDAWPLFVDRFLGLVSTTVGHAADCRGVLLSSADREDLVADVFVTLLDRDMAVLRRFQRRSSLATYLAVIARRVAVRRLMQRAGQSPENPPGFPETVPNGEASVEQRVADSEQVAEMLGGLAESEAQVVRLFHLEGRTYHEISLSTGVPENSIGPVLSRARSRLRRQGNAG
ncbi:RNA polymerase sigma factor [Planctomycetes bacterium MalM25]|nr:RNA polymerase sigma factor [Planctomycetes bacterium MalM25]